ncbi:MAG TPA: menaquinone biosynthesis decarboxylase [Bacteroidales bacterium]|nr:menaquinone biosynthesis decarboxylase [Bacteroidales bacterium]HPS18444.1 menaquinone biosynthesis decarboxylase [Bacteroidales bacterium]
MYKNLQEFIVALEKAGELIRVKEFVSPDLEIAEVTDRISKAGGKALLFENTGTHFPVLINSMGSMKRICMALGVNDIDDVGADMEKLFKQLVSPKESLFDKLKLLPTLNEVASWMPKVINKKAACQEVVMKEPDLKKLPILKCWPYDGGKFITLPLVHTVDPVTGTRNLGMYRMQIFEKDLTGMHWHIHKNSARHYREYKKLGLKMPVAVALGGDPVYTYAATAPLPDNIDEYLLAGFLRKKKVELVKCITQNIEVPADADFIIEGYVDPSEEMIWEGPFGDHTGYYSLPDWYPRFHVTCITHRKDAVYPSTIVGIPPQEDAYIGKATERIFLMPIRMVMLPEILDMTMPPEGVFHNLAIVKIKKEYPGHAAKVMNSLWGAGQMMFNKMMIVVDEDLDIHDYSSLIKNIFKNISIPDDIIFSRGPMDVLDHASSEFAYGGKIGIDATNKRNSSVQNISSPDTNILLNKYSDIKAINSELLKDEIPVIIISIEKNNLKEIASQIAGEKEMENISIIIFCENGLDITHYDDVVWSVLNNIDAVRDCYIIETNNKKLIIDGTRKMPDDGTYKRLWPNVNVMDAATIENIDKKWKSLGVGEFISSPSLKYKALLKGDGAIAK